MKVSSNKMMVDRPGFEKYVKWNQKSWHNVDILEYTCIS